MLLLKGICVVYFSKSLQGRIKYNIDTQHHVAVLLNASGKAPCGYWFLVAVSAAGHQISMYLLCTNTGKVTEAIYAHCLVIWYFPFCTNLSLFIAL